MAIGFALNHGSSQILDTMDVNYLAADATKRRRSTQQQRYPRPKHAKMEITIAYLTLGSMEKVFAAKIGSFLMTDITAARNPVGYVKILKLELFFQLKRLLNE